MDKMTLKALDGKDAWQIALKAPIPANANVELLYKARTNLIEYLDWYSNDGPSGIPREQMRIDLTEAVDRLYELCVLLQDAMETENQASFERDDKKMLEERKREIEERNKTKNKAAAHPVKGMRRL